MKTSLCLLLAGIACITGTAAAAQDYRARMPEDEIIYFLLPDRFENGDTANDKGRLRGDRLATGFDPAHKGYFHGGDLKGLRTLRGALGERFIAGAPSVPVPVRTTTTTGSS